MRCPATRIPRWKDDVATKAKSALKLVKYHQPDQIWRPVIDFPNVGPTKGAYLESIQPDIDKSIFALHLVLADAQSQPVYGEQHSEGVRDAHETLNRATTVPQRRKSRAFEIIRLHVEERANDHSSGRAAPAKTDRSTDLSDEYEAFLVADDCYRRNDMAPAVDNATRARDRTRKPDVGSVPTGEMPLEVTTSDGRRGRDPGIR